MTLRLSKPLSVDMVEHCIQGKPLEACGLLATSNGEVVKVFRMTNAAGSPVRYSLDPKEQFAAYQKIEEEGWELGAVFHSHTHTDAYPSPTDVRMSTEDVPYVIVSLAVEPPSIRAFRILKENWTDDEGEIEEIPMSVDG